MQARLVEQHGVLNMVAIAPRAEKAPRFAYFATLAIAALMAAVSVVGVGSSALYGLDPVPAFGIATSSGGVIVPGFAAHDAFNAIVALPLLLVTLWSAWRGAALAARLWPGLLFYVLYSYAIALAGAPFGPLFLAHVALVTASALTIATLCLHVPEGLHRAAPRWTGGLLIGLAVLTAAQDVGGVLGSQASGVEPLGRRVWTIDLTLEIPALLAGGVLVWRRTPFGSFIAPGLLLQFGLTPLALGVILASQPLLTGAPVDVGTTIGVLSFAVVSIVPLGYLARDSITWNSLWGRWVVANVVGEIVGFGLAALVGAALLAPIGTATGPAATGLMLLGVAAIGGLEGSAVGMAQWYVLRAALPGLRRRAWLAATICGAVVAWAAGMAIGPMLGDDAAASPLMSLIGAAAIGIVAGVLLSAAQWLVLRQFVSRAGWWVLAHALAWAVGMIVAFVGMSAIGTDTPMRDVAAVGAITGLAMGALVAALTGVALVRLLDERVTSRNLVRNLIEREHLPAIDGSAVARRKRGARS